VLSRLPLSGAGAPFTRAIYFTYTKQRRDAMYRHSRGASGHCEETRGAWCINVRYIPRATIDITVFRFPNRRRKFSSSGSMLQHHADRTESCTDKPAARLIFTLAAKLWWFTAAPKTPKNTSFWGVTQPPGVIQPLYSRGHN